MKKLITAAFLTALCTISTAALATPIALTGAFATDSLSNNNYSAVFSGKSFLPADYTVNSLAFSFTFRDDGSDSWNTSAPVRTSSTQTGWKYHTATSYANYVTNYDTVQRTGERESASLSIGGFALGSGSTAMSQTSSTASSGLAVKDEGRACRFLIWNCHHYYTKTKTTTTTVSTDYSGEFTISGIISNQSIIDELLRSDQLTLNLNVMGDLVLTKSALLLDYTKAIVPAAEVPEPSSILLALAGLVGLGAVRRRSKAAKA